MSRFFAQASRKGFGLIYELESDQSKTLHLMTLSQLYHPDHKSYRPTLEHRVQLAYKLALCVWERWVRCSGHAPSLDEGYVSWRLLHPAAAGNKRPRRREHEALLPFATDGDCCLDGSGVIAIVTSAGPSPGT
jgi:hypothetical protein